MFIFQIVTANVIYLDDNLFSHVKTNTSVVSFFDDDCELCNEFALTFYDVSDSFDGAQFFEVNCDKYPDFCKQYSIKSFPAVRFISNKTTLKYKGHRDSGSLKLWIEFMLKPVL